MLRRLSERAALIETILRRELKLEEHATLILSGKELDSHVRISIAKHALAKTSRYAATSLRGVLSLVWSSDPLVLTKHRNELIYLQESLKELQGAQTTSELWQVSINASTPACPLHGPC